MLKHSISVRGRVELLGEKVRCEKRCHKWVRFQARLALQPQILIQASCVSTAVCRIRLFFSSTAFAPVKTKPEGESGRLLDEDTFGEL